jgi:large subunit ribosomal protein L10
MAGNFAGYHLRRLTVGLNLNDKKAVVAEVSAKVATAQTIIVASRLLT